jgi:outer membrane lipoprotein-sorting protein
MKMNRNALIIFAMVLMIALNLENPSLLFAQAPSSREILEKVDLNISSKTRIFNSKMVIHGRRGSRTVASRSWAEGDIKAFTEYLAPAREKGMKMLKLKDRLWMYSPSTDRTIQISGHMLRQSLMGSDLSYEDMMEDKKLVDHYDASVTGTERVDGNLCWVLDLIATTENIAYQKRKLWVDQAKYIPLREELYAKGGKLLKRLVLKDVVQIQERWFPKRMIFKDVLKKGKGTEFVVEEIIFDEDIPKYIFSKAALRK